MSEDDSRVGGRVPTVMRIRLKYADVDAFIEKFAVNISRGGIFIASKQPRPVGTMVRFEFQLAQGAPVIRGDGEVVWVKPFEAEHPTRPHGMGVRFVRLDPESRGVVDRALAWKEQSRAARAEGNEPIGDAVGAAEESRRPTPPSPPPRPDRTPATRPPKRDETGDETRDEAIDAATSHEPPISHEPPPMIAAGDPVPSTAVNLADVPPTNAASIEGERASSIAADSPDRIAAAISPQSVAEPLDRTAPPATSLAPNHLGAKGGVATADELAALAIEWGLTSDRIAEAVARARVLGASDLEELERQLSEEERTRFAARARSPA